MESSPPGQSRAPSHSQLGVIRRIRLACAHCRRRKTKCSGHQPSCQQCQLSGQSCVYKAPTTVRKPTHHAPQFDTQWTCSTPTNELLHRLSSVEQALSDLTKKRSHTATINSPSGCPPEINPLPDFLDIPIAESNTDNHSEDLADNWDLQYETLPSHVIDSVIELYFTRVHGRPYAFFRESHFRGNYDRGAIPPILILSVLATAIRFSRALCFQGINHHVSDNFSSRAWQQILEQHLVRDDGLDLTVIQAVTLLAIVDYTAGRVSSGWLRLGLAIRLAQEAELMTGDEAVSCAATKEQRQMTAWSIYMLDKLMSSSLSRPLATEDSHYRMPLPGFDVLSLPAGKGSPTLQEFLGSHTMASSLLCPTSLAILSCSILGQCTKYVSGHTIQNLTPPWHHDSEFIATNSNLYLLESLLQRRAQQQTPQETRSSGCLLTGDTPQSVFAEAVFHLCHCLLNHPFTMRIMLQQVDSPPPRSFITQTMHTAEHHAQSLTDLLTSNTDDSLAQDLSYFTYCLAIACGIHSLFRHAKDRIEALDGDNSAGDYFRRSMTALYNLSELWPMGSNMHAKLTDFEDSSKYCSSLISINQFGEQVDESIQRIMWPLIDHRCLARGDSTKSSPVAIDMMNLSTPLSWEIDEIFRDSSVVVDVSKTR
ncbi:hypothetical protein CC79DRAFT_1128877 [Sarocladium strictum]